MWKRVSGKIPLVAASLSISIFQSIPTNTWTVINFDTIEWNHGNLFTLATPSKIIFPYSAVYSIFLFCKFSLNGTNDRMMNIKQNGLSTVHQISVSALSTVKTSILVGQIEKYVPNDYIEMNVWQGSGAALDIESAEIEVFMQSII